MFVLCVFVVCFNYYTLYNTQHEVHTSLAILAQELSVRDSILKEGAQLRYIGVFGHGLPWVA